MNRCRRATRVHTVAAALAAGVLAPGSALASSWHVPGDAETIADALELAAAWDTIYVDDARYQGEDPVTVDFDVQIDSMDGDPVDYPAFLVRDATLRLARGVVYGDNFLSGESSSGAFGDEFAAVMVLGGTFEATEVDVHGDLGFGVYAIDADLSLHDCEVSGTYYTPGVKLAAWLGDVALTVSGTTLTGNEAGAIYVLNLYPNLNYAAVTVSDGAFSYNYATEYGADLRLVGIDLVSIADTTFSAASAGAGGGSIYAYQTELSVEGGRFEDNWAPNAGSILAGTDTGTYGVTLTDVTFSGGLATDLEGAGGEVAVTGVDLVVDGVRASASSAVYGGFLYAAGGSVLVRESVFHEVFADAGGAIFLSEVSDARVEDTRICGGGAFYGGALVAWDSTTALARSVVQATETSGGTAVHVQGGAMSVVNDTFVENPGPYGMIYLLDARAEVIDNIFAGATTGVLRMGTSVVDAAGYNLYWELDTVDAGYGTMGGDLYVDPRFDASFDPTVCGEPFLAPGSPAIDAGDPSREDPDGTRADIGAYPAVGTEPGDTGDTGPDDTGPGDTAADADGDGVSDGEDCAPDDPAVYPGAWDDPLDEVDQDCDGDAATGAARGGCGCDAGGSGPTSALVLLALLAARRRSLPR